MEDDVRVARSTSVVLCALLSDACARAEQIAGLFRQRWLLQPLSRWVKQPLKIASPVDTYEGVVSSQIVVALIAFVLLRMAQTRQKAILITISFSRPLRGNLILRRSLKNLRQPLPTFRERPQSSLNLC
jgi:hypothetical protein